MRSCLHGGGVESGSVDGPRGGVSPSNVVDRPIYSRVAAALDNRAELLFRPGLQSDRALVQLNGHIQGFWWRVAAAIGFLAATPNSRKKERK